MSYIDERAAARRHSEDLTASATARLVRALRAQARADRLSRRAEEHLSRVCPSDPRI